MAQNTTGSRMAQRLQGINGMVGARLDQLSSHFPAPKESALPFTEYLARASQRAQEDPEFKNQFEQAMRQYRMASEVLRHGPNK